MRDWYDTTIETVADNLRSLRASNSIDPSIDPEKEAYWLIGLWQGLQLHTFYSDTIDVAEGLFGRLDEVSGAMTSAARTS
ncbi:MAG: hypothetical protein JWR83_190 [Aeromicrobium sp.]|nr:hypothetical protein [Aeromicrobium sp.]